MNILTDAELRAYPGQRDTVDALAWPGIPILVVLTAVALAIIAHIDPSLKMVMAYTAGGCALVSLLILVVRGCIINKTKESTLLLEGFYLYGGRNIDGRTFDQILDFNDNDLEIDHNWVQWLIPSMEVSKANPTAPVLTREIAEAIKANDRQAMKAIHLILNFWGLKIDDQGRVVKGENYAETITVDGNQVQRNDNWQEPPAGKKKNHNYLRVTRLICFLKLIGKEVLAYSLVSRLTALAEENTNLKVSLPHWRGALTVSF